MEFISTLDVSLSFIALCAASPFLFAAWIGPLRGKTGIVRGDGGNSELFKRMRIHGNFIEVAPLFALVLLGAEALGANDTWLWVALGVFFVGRVYHYVRYDTKDRGVGMALSTAPSLALGIYVLYVLYGLH